MKRFGFAFDGLGQVVRLIGVHPGNAWVEVDEREFRVKFGLWSLHTPLDNIVAATRSGPYRVWKGLGIRLSLADLGVTFGTTTAQGVCVEFRTPVRGVLGPLAHRAATVTVDDPDGLVQALAP